MQIAPPERQASASDVKKQIDESVRRLGQYVGQENTFKKLKLDSWTDFFELLTPHLKTKKIVVYLNIKPFHPNEIATYLDKMGWQEQLMAMLCVGEIPEYLKQLRDQKSVLVGLARKSFLPTSFFSEEYQRIFVSSMARNPHYHETLRHLSRSAGMTREELAQKLRLRGTGGSFSQILDDLEKCGFIQCLTPVHMPNSERLRRFVIADEYLAFYHNLIEPKLSRIQQEEFAEHPERGFNRQQLQIFLGLAFERWCRKHHGLIAKHLGFSGVEYSAGQYFQRDKKGIQIDLMFLRAARRAILLEAKYTTGNITPRASAALLREKWSAFVEKNTSYKGYTVQCALVTNAVVASLSPLREDFDIVIEVPELLRS